ncbi:DUF4347 domain-containing protein [Pseudoduganella sp. FT93W]|uniref:DUF4347 domain-containing protein n=1 Tax=Duganella fentianensis TaxID=2692177 RepID=A0A845HWV9_9BURK|nr:Ig-like domain-containing protein [Duganella fentianensis]MYN44207.1 DUF4347 domain-containing protein [Duganella fentianensis]
MNQPTAPTPRRRALRRTSHLLSLEQRFMFDGAAVTTMAEAAHAAQVQDSAVAVPAAVTLRAAEPAKDGGKKEVVLVDTSVANYRTMEAGVRAGVGIVEFDGSKDGLAQIAQWAVANGGYDAIHILSHGESGALHLGTTSLNETTLTTGAVASELAQLGQALKAGGDLMLYGCNIGDRPALLDGLARATGADVAASTDLTGSTRLGGNWTLEAHRGNIDSRALELASYDGVLATDYSFSFFSAVDESHTTADGYAVYKSVQVGATTVNITFNAQEIYIDQSRGLYATQHDGTVKLTIRALENYSFDLKSFTSGRYFPNVNQEYTFTGIKADGSPFAGLTLRANNAMLDLPFYPSLLSSLSDLREVTISTDEDASLQFIVLTDLKPAPPVSYVNSLTISADSGSNNSDGITNVASQTIRGGITTALGINDIVEVSVDNGSSWNRANLDTYTTWSYSTSLLNGSNTLLARVTNTTLQLSSVASTFNYTLDTSAPALNVGSTALSNDSGASHSDLLTNGASQTVTVNLGQALENGTTLYGSSDGSNWVDITNKVGGSQLFWSGLTLSDGANILQLKATDLAGNTSAPLSLPTITLDRSAPGTTVATASFSDDSGSSGSDFVTNMASQTISGTLSANLAADERVYVSINNGATWAVASTSAGQNTWSLAGVTLSASNTLKVKVSDYAGNDSTIYAQAYTYDTSAPAISFNSVTLSADSGSSNNDLITRTAAQIISATLSSAPAGSDIVYGSLDGGNTWTNLTAMVSGTTLNWTGVTLNHGNNTLQLRVADAAGNYSTASTRAYTLDTSAPVQPGAPVLDSASDSGSSSSDHITNITTPTLTGSTEAGATVEVYDGASLLGSTVADGSGNWRYSSGTLAAGTRTLTVKATDAAGNRSQASSALSIEIDSSAATVASVAVPADATYYNGSSLNFTVNFDESVFVDTSGGTPRISLAVGAQVRYASYVSGSGSHALVFSYTVLNGDSDSNGITLGSLQSNGGTLRDTAGNDATLSMNGIGSTAAVLIDGSLPSVTSVSASSADGAYGAGRSITITLDFSSAVDVDTSGGTPTLALSSGGLARYVGGSGSSTLSFSYTVGANDNSTDLDYSSTSALALNGATIKDAGGIHLNAALTLMAPGTAGSLAANKALVIDTTAPAATGASVVFSADSGSSATDRITNVASQSVSGTLTASLADGESVQVSADNGASWSIATASGTSWSLAAPVIVNGNGSIRVRVVDAAGNIGSVSSFAYVLDNSAPTTSFSNISFSNDTGASNSDRITRSAAQTITATLSAPLDSGDLVYGSLDNGATWSDITSKVSASTLSWNGVTLGGSNTLKLRVTDAAGNTGSATSAAYVLDTTAPTTAIASAAFSADSGSSNSDFITNVAAQTISGTLSANLVAGEQVYVSLDDGISWAAASASSGQNTWSLSGVTLSASSTLQVRVSDTAGNNAATYQQAYRYLPTGPATTGASVLFSADSGSSATDRITSVALQSSVNGTLTASLAAGESVQVTLDSGASWNTVNASGSNWSLPTSLTLNGSGSIGVRVLDAAGNSGNAASFAYVLDSGAPTTSFSNIRLSNDSGVSSSDRITQSAAQTISATLSAPLDSGDLLEASLDNGVSWSDITASVSGTMLSWSGVTLSGSNTLKLRVTDAAGNVGSATSAAYVLDTTAPTTTIASASFSADSGSSNSDFITNIAAQTVSGTLSANLAADEQVLVSLDNGASWVAASASTGQNSWSISGVSISASNTLRVKVSDTAGNSTGNYQQAYVYDATLPAAATITPLHSTILKPTLGGSATLEAGDSLSISVGGASYTVTASAGSWTLDLASAVPASGTLALTMDTAYNVVATVTDRAGNSRSTTGSDALVLGYPAPPLLPPTTTVTSATLSQDSGSSASDFITNVATQTVSGSLSAALQAGERVEISLDGGASWSGASASGSSWSASVTLAGSNTLMVCVRSDGGSSDAYSQSYMLDTTAPVGPRANAQTSTTPLPVLSGSATLADGDSLSVSVGGAQYSVSASGGSWSLDLASATPSSGTLLLAAGSNYEVVASVTDVAGNRSSGSAQLRMAALPQVLTFALSSDSGSSSTDFITSVAAQTITGTLSAPLLAGQTVEVSADGGTSWHKASAAGSSWSASLTLSGSNTLAARVTAAGSSSTPLRQNYVLDSSAPQATPVLSAQTAAGLLTGTLSAALASGETLLASYDDGRSWSPVATSGQAWTLNSSTSVRLLVRDSAGNQGSALLVTPLVTPTQPDTPTQPEKPTQPETPVPVPVPVPVIVPNGGNSNGSGTGAASGNTTAGAPAGAGPVGSDIGASGSNAGRVTGAGQSALTSLIRSGSLDSVSWTDTPSLSPLDTLAAGSGFQSSTSHSPEFGLASSTGSALSLDRPPQISAPIADVAIRAGERLSLQIPRDAFSYTGSAADVQFSAKQFNDTPLPGWLKFDSKTARFEGTPPPGFEGTLSFRVTARDSQGREVSQVFKVVIGKQGIRTSLHQPEAADPVGRSSLAEQLRSARSSSLARRAALSA